MKFIQAETIDGNIEIFNLDNVLTVVPYPNNHAKILMGAGLFWTIKTDTIILLDSANDLISAVKGAK